ncbi:MAG: hypothetical protein II712_02760 [Erysipelotrichaceae bacterium]|nr:hypothetical protein [Erysipelotrichaceae bacterium]
MNTKETFSLKKILLMIAGVVIMAFGCGMLVKTGYGADTSNALLTGIANLTGFSVGNTNAIATVIFIIISYFLSRKRIGLGTVLVPLIISFPIDFAIRVCIKAPDLLTGILLDLIALYIVSFGAAITIAFDLGASPFDCLSLGIADRFHLGFVKAKYLLDAFCVVTGYLLKGEVGIGTLLCLLVMGPFISFNQKLLNRVAGSFR